MENVQLPEMQEVMNALNIRLSTAEAQNQTLNQVLNNTQTELVHVIAQVAPVGMWSARRERASAT